MYNAIGADYTISQAQKYPDDFSTILYVVSRYGHALTFASERLRDNYDIVLTAVTSSGMSLEYASERLKNNPTIVYHAVSNIGLALSFASHDLRNDGEIVYKAVSRSFMALLYASELLKSNVYIVLKAISKHYCSFEYASNILKSDKEFIRKAYVMNSSILEYASREVLLDIPFVTDLVKENVTSLDGIKRLTYGLRCLPKNTAAYIFLSYSHVPDIKHLIICSNISCDLTGIISEAKLVQSTREIYRKDIISNLLSHIILKELADIISDFTVDIQDLIESNSLIL